MMLSHSAMSARMDTATHANAGDLVRGSAEVARDVIRGHEGHDAAGVAAQVRLDASCVRVRLLTRVRHRFRDRLERVEHEIAVGPIGPTLELVEELRASRELEALDRGEDESGFGATALRVGHPPRAIERVEGRFLVLE